jgi:hypothetical protein
VALKVPASAAGARSLLILCKSKGLARLLGGKVTPPVPLLFKVLTETIPSYFKSLSQFPRENLKIRQRKTGSSFFAGPGI